MTSLPTGILFNDPQARPLSNSGQFQPGAYYLFYLTGSTTPVNVYADGALTTPLSQVPAQAQPSCTADAFGRFNPIYLNPAVVYRVQLFTSAGIKTEDTDPYVVPLSNLSAAAVGAALYPVSQIESNASVVPVNLQYPYGCVDRFATNTNPGVTDMSAAVRSALDCVPPNGGEIFFGPTNKYFLGSVVFIPQRMNAPGQRGIIIECNNSTLVGNGLGVGATGAGAFTTLGSGSIPSAMFETGTGIYSTVSKGGATNFGLGNELSTTLHYGTKIRNARLVTFGLGFHMFNFLADCEFDNVWGEQGYTLISDVRSFYSHWKNVNGFFQQSGAGRVGYPIFNLNDTINDRAFIACHAVGTNGTTSGADIGWQVNNGVQGCGWFGCSAEQCGLAGFNNLGEILGSKWTGGYFEANATVAMNLGSATVSGFVVEGNDFIGTGQPVAITASGWVDGRLGKNNYDSQSNSNNTVILTGGANSCVVEVPPVFVTETGTVPPIVPVGFQLGGAVQVEARRITYASSIGPAQEIAVDDVSNAVTAPKFAYSGGASAFASTSSAYIPFCAQTTASGSATITSPILFSSNFMNVVFDLSVIIAGGATDHIYGFIFSNGTILRGDALSSTVTTTASANGGGLLQIVIGGSALTGTTATMRGVVRHL